MIKNTTKTTARKVRNHAYTSVLVLFGSQTHEHADCANNDVQAHVLPFLNQLIGALDIFFMLNYWLIVEFHFQFNKEPSFHIAYLFE